MKDPEPHRHIIVVSYFPNIQKTAASAIAHIGSQSHFEDKGAESDANVFLFTDVSASTFFAAGHFRAPFASGPDLLPRCDHRKDVEKQVWALHSIDIVTWGFRLQAASSHVWHHDGPPTNLAGSLLYAPPRRSDTLC